MGHEVTRQAMDRMVAEARAAHPRECCGILLGRGNRIDAVDPTANVHSEPERFFEIDPAALIAGYRTARGGGPDIVGYYHSHPNGRPEPSATDRALAARDGKVWAIVGQNEVQFWRDAKDGFERLSYEVRDG